MTRCVRFGYTCPMMTTYTKGHQMGLDTEVKTRVSSDLLAAIDRLTGSERRSRSEIFRFALEEYTGHREVPEPDDEDLENAEDLFWAEMDDRKLRDGQTSETVIAAMARDYAQAAADEEEAWLTTQAEMWREGHGDEGESLRAVAVETLRALTYDGEFPDEHAYDAHQAGERQASEERRGREKATQARLRAILPGLFLAAMKPGADYGFSSPEFPEIVRSARESAGCPDEMSCLGDRALVTQTLDVLIMQGLVTKSGEKPRVLRKSGNYVLATA